MAPAAGAALILIPPEARTGPALREVLLTQRITVAKLPPVVLQTLDHGPDLTFESLIVAGEACAGQSVARWSRNRRMINAYGPTEATVDATMSFPLSGDGAPPLGRAVWNTRVYVLDVDLEPVPPGINGELHIAGKKFGARIFTSPGPHRGAFPSRSVRRNRIRGNAHVSHRRFGASTRGRRVNFRRPHRPPGENPRVPHRARRDPSGAPGT